MELLNKNEHLNCYLYNNQDIPLIEYTEIKEGETFVYNAICNQIIFLLKGKINFSCEYQINNVFEERTFLMFPHGYLCTMNVEENSLIVRVNMHNEINFCRNFPLEMLCELNEISKSWGYSLKVNKIISDYLENVVKTLSYGLKCAHFHDLKQKELLFYLRAYYPKKDLVAFFGPILNNDIRFAKTIYENYDSTKSIENLASIANYSVSGFKKRFVKVFGMYPRDWIEREKAKKMYYEINCTKETLQEIAAKYDFSSASHFNKFCKRVYGMPPSQLRKNTRQGILFNEVCRFFD